MTFRKCEICKGHDQSGDVLWDHIYEKYLCQNCHNNPYDPVFLNTYGLNSQDEVLRTKDIDRFEEGQTGPWGDNLVQFARLLCELVANWSDDTSAKHTIRDVSQSMDLSVEEVNEIFDRADRIWEETKRRLQ